MITKKVIMSRLLSTALFMFFSISLFAQLPQGNQQQVRTDFEQEEIEKFVEVNSEVVKVQQKAEQDAMKIIEEKDLEVQRFNELVAIQQGQSDEEASPEELAAFNEAAQEIMQNNQKTQDEMVKVLEANGVDEKTYQEMMIAYQQDKDFKNKVDKVVQKKNNG
jgi:hypothetical protein